MLKDYEQRQKAIERCIDIQKANIKELRQKQAENPGDRGVRNELNETALLVCTSHIHLDTFLLLDICMLESNIPSHKQI